MRVSILLSAALLLTGCTSIISGSTELYKDYLGSRSWVRRANLQGGQIELVVMRTMADGTLRGRFDGLGECAHCVFQIPVPNSLNKVRCEAIFPQPAQWNGTLLVLGAEGPGGNFPKNAPQRIKDGTAVVCCDGGMNILRKRDESPNPEMTGFKRPESRQTFMEEAMHLAVVGGKALTMARFGKAPEKTIFEGRESAGAQGVFLAQKYPEDVDVLKLQNPALDFWRTFLYEFNVSMSVRDRSGHMVLRDAQCEAVVVAAKQKNGLTMKEDEFFDLAANYDNIFSFSHTKDKIRHMWHELYTAESVSTNLNLKVDVVERGVDLKPIIRASQWRVHWFFGDTEYGHEAAPTQVLALRETCKALTPSGDLSAFAARGGKLEVVIEKNNAFVPKAIAEDSLKSIKGIKPTVKRVE